MKYNLILILLTVLAFAACKDKKEIKPLGKVMLRDTILPIKTDIENGDIRSTRGTKMRFAGLIEILHFSSYNRDSSDRDASYYSDSHTGELYIDTVYQGSASFVKTPIDRFIDQPHLNKIIIKSMAYELNPNRYPDDEYIFYPARPEHKRKEVLDCRVLKDLKSGEVEKIVVYIDSVEYLVDLNKNRITKRKE